MTEINSLYLTVLIELLAFFFVVCVAMVVVSVMRAMRERAAVEKVVATIKEDSARRKEETKNLLEKRFGYKSDALQKSAHTLMKKELLFYQTLINLYIKRDTKTMEELNVIFEDTVAPYRELEVSRGAAVQESAPVEVRQPDNAEELAKLRAQNQQLLEELELTMHSLGGMLSQYAAMLEKDADAGIEAMAQMIEEVAESGSEMPDEAAGDEEVDQSPAEQSTAQAEAEAVESTDDEKTTQNVVDDLEPDWDEALTEQLETGSQKDSGSESIDEAEPNWDEALAEQLEIGSGDASEEMQDDLAEPNWDEAEEEPEPNWDDALSEQREEEKKEG